MIKSQWTLKGSSPKVAEILKKACETYGNISLKDFIDLQSKGGRPNDISRSI